MKRRVLIADNAGVPQEVCKLSRNVHPTLLSMLEQVICQPWITFLCNDFHKNRSRFQHPGQAQQLYLLYSDIWGFEVLQCFIAYPVSIFIYTLYVALV